MTNGRCGLNNTCEWWITTQHNTDVIPAGWQGIRVKPRLELGANRGGDGPNGGDVMLTSGDLPVCIRSCLPFGTEGTFHISISRGWYDHGRDYQNPVLEEGQDKAQGLGGTVSGVWNIHPRLGPGSGGDPTTAASVWTDAEWHMFDEDSFGGPNGRRYLNVAGEYDGPVAIDTRNLSDGRHELILRVEGRHTTGRLVGLQYVPFVVRNDPEKIGRALQPSGRPVAPRTTTETMPKSARLPLRRIGADAAKPSEVTGCRAGPAPPRSPQRGP